MENISFREESMKKSRIILVIVLGAVLGAAGFLAAEPGNGTYFGPILGLNFSSLIGDNSDAVEFYGGGEKMTRMAFAAGAFAHFGFGGLLALEPQILFSQKGGKYGDADPAWNDELTLKIDYLEAPVLVRVYIPLIPVVKASVFGGGYAGYNVTAKYRYEETGYEEEGDIEDAFFYPLEELDYWIVFGAGAVLPLAGLLLRLDARYSLGLAKLFDIGFDDDLRNGVFAILASIGL
jgi:hypothetical protein